MEKREITNKIKEISKEDKKNNQISYVSFLILAFIFISFVLCLYSIYQHFPNLEE